MKNILFLCSLSVLILTCSNTVFADTPSYHDKAVQCSQHGYKLCWRYCLVAAKQQAAGETVKLGAQCDVEHNKQFTHTPFKSKTDPDYLPSDSTWLDNDVVGTYRRDAGRSRHVIDALSNLEWNKKCASTARIEPAVIESLMTNGIKLRQGIKIRLSKIQVAATSGNSFSCKAGKVDVLN